MFAKFDSSSLISFGIASKLWKIEKFDLKNKSQGHLRFGWSLNVTYSFSTYKHLKNDDSKLNRFRA